MSWFSSASYSEACVSSSSLSSSLVFSERLSSHEFVPRTDLKCVNHSSEEISLPLPAPLFILLTAFQNDCWSRRFFVKPSHLFSLYPPPPPPPPLFSFSFFFSLLEQTMVFCPLCYINNPIATILSSFPSSQQSFHTFFRLPTFTIKPCSPLLFSLSIKKHFLHWLSSVHQKRQIYQAPCSDHVQSVQSPLPEYL